MTKSGTGKGTPKDPFKYSLRGSGEVAYATFTSGSTDDGVSISVQQLTTAAPAACTVVLNKTVQLTSVNECIVLNIITDPPSGGLTLNVRGKRNDPGGGDHRRHKHPEHPEDGK